MTTGLLITTAGQAAIAADLAGGANLVLTHVAFGDANGVPYNPVEAQTQLVRERYRSTIASVAVLANEIIVDAIIPADTPDATARPSHGFNVAECGLFAADGTMIGVARMGNGIKPSPASGQAAIATFRLKLAVANPSAISVVIDPQAQIIVGRHVRPFWLTVDGVLNNPPANPVQGATYVIGNAPTGAWAGFAGRLAQWVGVWSLATCPDQHVVRDNSRAEGDPLAYLRFSGGGWVSAASTEAAYGVTRLATEAEAAAGLLDGVAISPLRLRRALSALRGATEWTVPGAYTWTVPAGVTSVDVTVIGGGGAGGSSGSGTSGGLAGNVGAGGGGGGYAFRRLPVTPGANLSVIVGAGGIAYAAPLGGGNGGTSSVAGSVSASGGSGGVWGENGVAAGGQPGVGVGGAVNLSGTIGGFSGPNSTTPTVSDTMRFYGRGGMAAGGLSIANLAGTGQAGIGAGSGGTGASGGVGIAGGAGAPGAVIMRW